MPDWTDDDRTQELDPRSVREARRGHPLPPTGAPRTDPPQLPDRGPERGPWGREGHPSQTHERGRAVDFPPNITPGARQVPTVTLEATSDSPPAWLRTVDTVMSILLKLLAIILLAAVLYYGNAIRVGLSEIGEPGPVGEETCVLEGTC